MWKKWKRRDLAGDKTDYDRYCPSVREGLLCLGKSAAVTGAFSYMFYRSFAGFLAFPAVLALLAKRERKEKVRRRKERLSRQFRDTILAVTAGMQAGSSIENAFLEAETEIVSLYGRESEMAYEMGLIHQGLKNRIPLEKMLLNLGERSHVEEIRDFTEVFAIAKRQGGNLKEIVRRTAELTEQRMEVEREITTMLAAKKYEQRVMNLIPFLLYGYMQVSSKGFFDILYHNAAGIIVMTVCLLLYLLSCVTAEKIMDIRV